MLAGIGRGQLKVLAQRVQKKREIFDFYKKSFRSLEGIEMMPVKDTDVSNCWLSCIYLSGKVKPQAVIAALEAENIESRPIWKPMHMQPFFDDCDFIGGDVAQKIFENGVCLPSDTKMTDEDLNRIVDVIKGLW